MDRFEETKHPEDGGNDHIESEVTLDVESPLDLHEKSASQAISIELCDWGHEMPRHSTSAVALPISPLASFFSPATTPQLSSQLSISQVPSNELLHEWPLSCSVSTLDILELGKVSDSRCHNQFNVTAESSTTKLLGTKSKSELDTKISDYGLREINPWPSQRQTNDKPESSIFSRVRHNFGNQFDMKAILHLLDFRPWFWPITIRKYVVLFMIACAIAGIIISNFYFHWIRKSLNLTRSYMFPVLITTVCAEPAITFVILMIAKIPKISKYELSRIMNEEDENLESYSLEKRKIPLGPFETALVIPCHNTDESTIRTTIDSALPHFRAQDIFIVYNGPTRYPKHPTCNFRSYIRSIHPDIVYIWSPIGSKNAAQFIGTLAAKDYKYIMTVDDDVCIPKNYYIPKEMIDDKFKAVAYGIKAIDAKGNTPLWLVAWQDVEYRLSGLSKAAEDRLCGVLFPHGAGWFLERECFAKMLENYHPMDFIAEDCNAGLGIHKMGKGIRYEGRCFLATEAPRSFFGPGLNWWKQRQKSWEMGRHGRLFAFLKQLFFCLPARKTPQGILWHKISYLYLICTIAIDWLRIPTIIALGRTTTWWRNALLLMLFSALPPLYFKCIKCRHRPDLQPQLWASITYFWYKQIYLVVAILGAVRAIGYFAGGHKRPLTIKQMIRRNDDRCFWLDPRFVANPGWLADEADDKDFDQNSATLILNKGTYVDTMIKVADIDLDIPKASYCSTLIRTKTISDP